MESTNIGLRQLGALHLGENSTRFRVWAPGASGVELRIIHPGPLAVAMQRQDSGYWQVVLNNAHPGTCLRSRRGAGPAGPHLTIPAGRCARTVRGRDWNVLNFELRHTDDRRTLLRFCQTLLQLRREAPPLASLSKEQTSVETDEEAKILIVRRSHGEDEVLLALCFSETGARVELPRPPERWSKLLDSADEAWLGPGSGLPAEMDSPGSVEFALKPRSAVNGRIHLHSRSLLPAPEREPVVGSRRAPGFSLPVPRLEPADYGRMLCAKRRFPDTEWR